MSSKESVSRREFVKVAAVGTAALSTPMILSSAALGQDKPAQDKPAPSEPPVRVGFIGIGKMGHSHLTRFVTYKEAMVTAVADIDTTRREGARLFVDEKYAEFERKNVNSCKAYKHYKELLADKDIDAVLIAVPDHWHAAIAIEACKAKKDIYCEKPLTLTIHEAKTLIDATRKHDRVFQTGSQQRSEGPFAEAVDMIRAGRIGKIKEVHVGIGPTSKPCGLFPETPHEGVDWNEWLGQAPERPYNHVLCQNGMPDSYPFNPGWRDYREFSGGYVTDWGAHHFDITQWALDMDKSGPVEIRPPKKPGDLYGVELVYRNSPSGDGDIVVTHKEIIYEYEAPDKDGKMKHTEKKNGILFIGSKGKLFVDRSMMVSEPDDLVKTALSDSEKKVYRPDGKGKTPHHQDWLDCIKNRKRPLCDVEVGARSVTVCHLVNLAYWHDAKLTWDPEKWEFTGDNAEAANKLRTREVRKGFELPEA